MKRSLLPSLISIFALVAIANTANAKPRVASINVCADQLIMLLADPEQIVSLSHLSMEEAGSYFYKTAANYSQNEGTAESLFGQSPDVVLAGQFTVSYTPRLLEDLGIKVERIAVANSIDDAIALIRRVAVVLDQQDRGEAIVKQMHERLRALPPVALAKPRAAVYDANGYTVGANTMRGDALRLSGWSNVAEELGIESYGTLSLEALVHLWPDAVLESPYAAGSYSRAHQLTRHPAIGKTGFNPLRITVPSNKAICAGPWSLDVVEALVDARVRGAVAAAN